MLYVNMGQSLNRQSLKFAGGRISSGFSSLRSCSIVATAAPAAFTAAAASSYDYAYDPAEVFVSALRQVLASTQQSQQSQHQHQWQQQQQQQQQQQARPPRSPPGRIDDDVE